MEGTHTTISSAEKIDLGYSSEFLLLEQGLFSLYYLKSCERGLSQWEKTLHINGLMQERRNFIANALELRFSCTKPSIYVFSLSLDKTCPQDLGKKNKNNPNSLIGSYCQMRAIIWQPLLGLLQCSAGPVFCLLLGVSSGCARPIAGQVTSVTWPVIGWAQSELTRSKRQKSGLGQFSPISPQQTPHCLPIRASNGVFVVSFKSDSCSAAAIVAVLCVISW